jgi:hypothetical protein
MCGNGSGDTGGRARDADKKEVYTMAVKRTRTGYQLWRDDAEGKFRKRTIKGIALDEAVRPEREILAARDRGSGSRMSGMPRSLKSLPRSGSRSRGRAGRPRT